MPIVSRLADFTNQFESLMFVTSFLTLLSFFFWALFVSMLMPKRP